uniref:secreted frizzled-related protein 5-like n=1 Tax=Myxine glutinosa TaxID=7769 RepID=UPI00358E13D0
MYTWFSYTPVSIAPEVSYTMWTHFVATASTLLLFLLVSSSLANPQEYDYTYGWQADTYYEGAVLPRSAGVHFYSKQPVCLPIPTDLRLCQSVGYSSMRLPNLLEHESLPEVLQQAGSWVPLLARRCHPDTQRFLCSLFAPVCLDRPIFPCRSLCEAVRDSCAPVMESFGFPWPEMLRCNRFPLDNDLCVTMQFAKTKHPLPVSMVCPQCDGDTQPEALLEHVCASEFGLKMRLREVKRSGRDRRLVGARRKRKVFRAGSLRRKELRRPVLFMKNGADCLCPQLDSQKGTFLILGRRAEQRLLLTGIYRMGRRNKELRQVIKTLKHHKCPVFHTSF